MAWATRACAAWVIATCTLVLAGWAFNIPTARSLVPGWMEMNPVTAVTLIGLATALWVQLKPVAPTRGRLWLATALAGIAALVGVARITGYAIAPAHGDVDRLLFQGSVGDSTITLSTAFNLVLLGVVLMLMDVRPRALQIAQQAALFTAAFIAANTLLGYLYRAPTSYALHALRPMPFASAVCFLPLCVAIVLARPERGLAAILGDRGMGGLVARRLLPPCILLPVGLGALRIALERADILSPGTAPAAVVLIMIGFMLTLIWRASLMLIRFEQERREIESQLRDAKGAADVANQAKSAFVANVSHELRTPLTAIVGFADLYFQQHHAAEKDQSVQTIRRNGDHLLTIINDLLDLAKIEAGRMQLENLACSPAQLATTVMGLLRHKADEKKLSLEIAFDGRIPQTIRTDPTRLRQVLINLVSNAIKFTQDGGVKITLGMATQTYEAEPMLRISVTDTGIGIAADEQQKLFEPFTQSDASMTRRFGGTGLGLSVARHCARLLGGNVTVTSEVGRGSTFACTVRTGSLLGVALLSEPPAMESFSSAPAAMPAPLAPVPSPVPPGPSETVRFNTALTVLLAEDGPDNQKLIGHWLKAAGIHLDIVGDGRQAVDRALKARAAGAAYDVVLMDMQMPVLDGLSATRELREANYAGPIIALTANASSADRDRCLQAGCNDFLTKPIDRQLLVQTIARFAKRSQATRPAAAA